MKTNTLFVLLIVLTAMATMGARGCDVWVETDGTIYEMNTQGLATLYNNSGTTLFLPGCSQFSMEQLVDDVWEDRGPSVLCFWEGISVPIAPGESFDSHFLVPDEMGIWRLNYTVSWGCEEGKALSQSNCTEQETLYSPQIEIVAQTEPQCVDLSGIQFGLCDRVLGWVVVDGTCQLMSGCDNVGFAFFATELDCLNQCETECPDWSAAHANLISQTAQCTYDFECVAVSGSSCGCTRNLVVNRLSDIQYIQEFFADMANAGCGFASMCDCPPANGFVCDDGTCRWNYL